MHNHAFYITLGYGLSALVVVTEVASLVFAARRRKLAAQFKDSP